jgi:undecaprenyl-diphosphatase
MDLLPDLFCLASSPWPSWDADVLRWTHAHARWSWVEHLAPIWRDKRSWLPLYLVLLLWLYRRYQWRGVALAIMAGLCVGISDGLVASVLKPAFGRARPCHDPDLLAQLRLLIDCGPGRSFPSAHASNHMALAVFVVQALPKRHPWILVLLLWALSIAWAQVYVGVHYPLDAGMGMLFGGLIGAALAWVYRRLPGDLVV